MVSGRLYPILRRVFSFPVMLGVLLAAGAFASTSWEGSMAGGKIFVGGDTWWHLAVGERILRTGRWPTSDTYSFTVAGHVWMAHEWLGELLIALAARLGGLRGMAAWLIVQSIALMLSLYYLTALRSRNVKAAFVACVLVLPIVAFFFDLRPQIFGYILLLIVLLCLERFREGRQKTLWILPIVFLAWVNTHGTFTLGLVVLAAYWMGGLVSFRRDAVVAEPWTVEQRRHLAVIFLLCVLMLGLTPYGTRPAAQPLEFMLFQPDVIRAVTEWEPLYFSLIPAKVFLFVLLLFVLGQVLRPATYRLEEIALLLFATYESCLHIRLLVFFAFVFAPLLARQLAVWIPGYQSSKDRCGLNAALIVLLLGGMVAMFPSSEALEQLLARKLPRGAVEYLRQHPVARGMFNEDTWGGYLIWSLGPAHKVFIDGRAEIYGYGGVLSDYLRITSLAPDALYLLRKYGVEACLLHRESPLGTFLAALPGWKLAYTDEVSTLFVQEMTRVTEPSGSGGHRGSPNPPPEVGRRPPSRHNELRMLSNCKSALLE